jgi:hypothetical protein
MDLRDNFKTKCKARFNADGTHWYCTKQLSEKQEIESKTCNYSRCPGRELTEEEETTRLLEIESRMKDTKRDMRRDPMEELFKRMKREMDKIEAEDKAKVNPAIKPSKKPLVKPIQEKKVEPIIAEIKKTLEIVKPKKAEEIVKPIAIIEQPKNEEVVIVPKVVEDEHKEEKPNLKKCEWHLCQNNFDIGNGSKKEKFCSRKCCKKESNLNYRRRQSLRKKELSTK